MKNNTSNATVQVNNEDQKKQNIQNQLTEHVNNMENHKNNSYYMRSKNILSPETIEKEFRNTMMHGLPTGINSGISNLDELFRLDRGKLVVITGIPNMGKSEVVDALCVQYNMLYGMRTLFFSPENQPIGLHINKLFAKFVGRKYSQDDLLGEVGINVRNYIYDNFSFFNCLKEHTLPNILSTAEVEILGKGIDIVVIDSYNKILHDYKMNETEEIGRDLDHLERFAKRLNVIVILVAHPRKMEKDKNGCWLIPSAYDINGSANFANKADFVGTVHRVYDPNYTIVKISKVKFSNYGGQGEVHLGYDLRNGRFYDIPDMDFTTVLPPPPEAKPFDLDTHRKSGVDWLNVTCSASKRVTSKETSTVSLWDFLTCERPDLIESLNKVRAESDHKVASKAKVDLLPVVMPSVVIEGERKRENIREFTNLICIDIDKKDNEKSMEEVFEILKSLPYVAFAQKSCSGQGYYAIVPIKYGHNHLEHFLALEEDFAQMGIVIDKACKDEVRARFFSYDPDRYVAEKCEAYVRRAMPRAKSAEVAVSTATKPPRFSVPSYSSSPEKLMAKLNKACEGIETYDVCPSYPVWFEVGAALANELGEDGRRYFHQLSCGYEGYDPEEVDKKFSDILKDADRYSYTMGTVFHYIEQVKGYEKVGK